MSVYKFFLISFYLRYLRHFFTVFWNWLLLPRCLMPAWFFCPCSWFHWEWRVARVCTHSIFSWHLRYSKLGTLCFGSDIVVNQSLSRVWLLAAPWTRGMPGLPVNHQLPGIIQTQVHWVVMISNHLILCHPLLPPSVFPRIRIFSNESVVASGGQSIGVSASAPVLPMNIQDWFPLRLTVWTWLSDWTEPISFWTCWTWVSVPKLCW